MQKFLVLLSAILCLCLCLPAPGAHAAREASGKAAADGLNAFACDAYARLRVQKGNLFFSPLSISCALAAAGTGARGETAAQMARSLRMQLGGEQAHTALTALLRGLNTARDDGQPQIEIANSIWPHTDFSLRPEYVETAQKTFDAAVLHVDYARDAEAAAARINAWIADKTHGRIRDIIHPPPADTRLVLVNAVYFKGAWASPFLPENTEDDLFHAPGKAVRTPFMSKTKAFRYGEMKDMQILELPYKGGEFSLLVLLPAKTPGALEKLEKELSAQRLAQWTGALHTRTVRVFLPKFSLSWGPAALNDALVSLGMRDAFSPHAADFSGMSPDGGLFIGSLLHQANVDVDEYGTTAAAVTASPMPAAGPGGLPPIITVFRADRPFLFLIRDTLRGTVLFMGRLTEPGGP